MEAAKDADNAWWTTSLVENHGGGYLIVTMTIS
jgi:hypothetical protein